MAKIEFKAEERLLQRRRAPRESANADVPPPDTAGASAAPERPASAKPNDSAKRSRPRRTRHRHPDAAVPDVPAESQRPRSVDRRRTVQTAIRLPTGLWTQLDSVADDLGAAASTNVLLIATLRQHAPSSPEKAAELIAEYLGRLATERGVGELAEERNVRLPVELRQQLDDQWRVLAGVSRDYSRSNLIAATVIVHGPRDAAHAANLLAEQRAADVRAALAAARS